MKTVFYWPWEKWLDIERWGVFIYKRIWFSREGLGKKIAFCHYSDKLEINIDEVSAGDDCIIIKPRGQKDAEFMIGYCRLGLVSGPARFSAVEEPGICKVAPIRRKVSDGQFAIRSRLERSCFFAIGNKKIFLIKIGAVRHDCQEAKDRYKYLELY